MSPCVSLRNVGVHVGARNLLREINWDIEESSRWVVVGANGSGKTTLLSLIAACGTPSSGSIEWRGTSYDRMSGIELRRNVGFVSSSWFSRMYRQESVADVLMSGSCGTFGADFPNRLDAPLEDMRRMLALVGLEEKEDAPFADLSRGQQQMALILRATMSSPALLALDELTAGLDIVSRQVMREFVRNIAMENGCTLVYVTHYFEEISPDLFDGVLLLDKGAVFAKGTLDEVLTEETLGRFLGHRVGLGQDDEGRYLLRFDERGGAIR